MRVRLKGQEKLLDLQINYEAIFHSWFWLFNDDGFLKSDYMTNLMAFLFMAYRDLKPSIRPEIKTNIFKPFELCSIDTCNVVIVTEYPTTSLKSSGLGVGNKEMTPPYAFTSELELFKSAVETNLYSGNMYLGFDYTLEEPAENGVLFLNSALTCTEEDSKAHVKYWDKFMKFFLNQFQEATDNKTFLFIGDACKYANLIDLKYHTVFTETESLHECATRNKYWNTNILRRMNEHLEKVDSIYYRNPVI